MNCLLKNGIIGLSSEGKRFQFLVVLLKLAEVVLSADT